MSANPALPRILLREGAITVGIAPAAGGCLTRFDVRFGGRRLDILRPARDGNASGLWALGAASFLMLPYCGRLCEARFEFNGRAIRYPRNALPERHSSHGDAWTRRWTLTSLGRQAACMRLEDDPSLPLRYECTQHIVVSHDRLEVCIATRNTGLCEIPVGVGLHPYFANRSLAVLHANLPLQWQLDGELLPVAIVANSAASSMLRGQRVVDLPAVSEYAGWDGTAMIEWPALELKVRIETQPRLGHAVLWVPPGEEFFCFEPASHATDAQNGRPGHPPGEDFVILAPGALHEQRFAFIVEAASVRGSA